VAAVCTIAAAKPPARYRSLGRRHGSWWQGSSRPESCAVARSLDNEPRADRRQPDGSGTGERADTDTRKETGMGTIDTLQKQTPAIQRWTVDPAHTTVEFEVRHMWGLSSVSGRFRRLGGWYVVRPEHPVLELEIDPASVDTGNAARDKHLRSRDFFGVEEHPRIHFASTDIVDEGHGKLHVIGLLDVAGTPVPLGLAATTRWFGDELEIEATASVDQRDFGMSSGPFWSIRSPTNVHVKARLVPSQGLFG
jgi:polyisoprenoid-binding protein YceI